VIREWKAEGRPGGRDGLLLRLAAGGGVYVPKFYDVDYLPDGRIRRVRRIGRRTLPRFQAHADGPGQLAVPKKPLVPLAETVHERYAVEIFPRLHARLPVLPGRMITAPSGAQHRPSSRQWCSRDRGNLDWRKSDC
jgi:hypothetical protein